MVFFLLVFVLMGGSFAALFTFLPARGAVAVAVLSLLLVGYLWRLPRYYLLDTTGGLGGNNPGAARW